MIRRSSVCLLALAAACGGPATPAGPAPRPEPAPPSAPPAPSAPRAAGFAGFDTGIYPGDAAMRAWRQSSPYVWVGYYLPAPCHRDVSWSGTRERLVAMGWGTAVLYLGQQDWAAMPSRVPAPRDTAARDTARRDTTARTDSASAQTPSPAPAPSASPACSAANLSATRGTVEAADAAAKAAAEGFPAGTVIYLDVERVTSVSPQLAEYVRAWVDGVLADGRFTPGIYCHRLDADALNAAAGAAWTARGRAGSPPFWITSTSGFTLEQPPTGAGLAYATVWQGRLDVPESWGGYTLTIDANVADARSPSSPR